MIALLFCPFRVPGSNETVIVGNAVTWARGSVGSISRGDARATTLQYFFNINSIYVPITGYFAPFNS